MNRSKTPAVFLVLLTLLCCRHEKESVRVFSGEKLPAVSALAWLENDYGDPPENEGGKFVSVSDDGMVRVWDILTGLVSVAGAAEAGEELPVSRIGREFPVISPDGTKKIFPSADGAVILAETAGKELARYYGFGSGEWISVAAEGFYTGSPGGDTFLSAELGPRLYRMDQLSGALFRPDIFKALVLGKNAAPENPFMEIFREDRTPPDISLSLENNELKITITGQKGGAGLISLYSSAGGQDIPAGLFDIERAAEKKYKEKGNTLYELSLSLDELWFYQEEIVVSAFNKFNTVESERRRLPLYARPAAEENSAPVLRLILAGGGEGLGEFFSLQAEGDLYSAVEIKSFPDGESSLVQCLEHFQAANKNDVFVLYLTGQGQIDALGNLRIVTGGKEIQAFDLLQSILALPSCSLLLLDLPDVPMEVMESALPRFSRRLGPRAVLAGSILIGTVTEALLSGSQGRFVSAAEFLDHGAWAGFFISRPREDFRITDRLYNAGELRFQTMASGMLKIDRVDANPVPLAFGDTMSRVLPAGEYIIDMIYRNGYRETRTVRLREKESAWVTFSYTPPLLVGNFSRALPSLGISLSELNPANYERINREAMEGMGMAPYYVAFLAGEKFYREGSYDRAIAEYSRSISLKADYAEAYASRGNAERKKGDPGRAIEDYNRALRLRSNYAEVYNYRGFVYAERGDLARAVADYTQAIRYRADYADAYFNRAHAYAAQGSWDRAIADYTQVLRLEPSNAVAYNERGKARGGRGDTAGAAADFAAAERLRR